MNIEITDPKGFPDTIAGDLERAEFEYADDCHIAYLADADTVRIKAPHSNAAKALYHWLEDTAQYYRESYVDASGDYDAAKQMADRIYQEFRGSEGSV